MINLGQMDLKGVNRINNDITGSNGLEMSQLGTQLIKLGKPCGLEGSQLEYTMTTLGQMVLKGVNWVHTDKISLK